MKIKYILTSLLYFLITTFIANSFILITKLPQILFIVIPVFLFINIAAGVLTAGTKNHTLKFCYHGTILLSAFYLSVVASTVYHIILATKTIPDDYWTFIWSAVLCTSLLFVIFWNGIICVYLTSTQLGIKIRVIGVICGMIPIANLIALFFIIKTTASEVLFETAKEKLNLKRQKDKICATKYPILMVHGVFFRDSKFFNYWGRIPGELQTNGATIFYGNQPSAASVSECAIYIKDRVNEIISSTGAEKVNIIAHSKGGLDCRYAIAKLGIEDKVASLTTINTPHKGCLFADYLLTKIPTAVKNRTAQAYNMALKRFGEADSDFLAAVSNLTDSYCAELNSELEEPKNVFCQSVGSVLKNATGGKFPLNFSYHLVHHFSGANDGLVGEESFRWGEKFTYLKASGKCGISHGDMIDLNRENIKGFDVREFYVGLVSDLKDRGL
ncbi:MAG: triacylglycerol lipase [Ruminococcaceae bacterium]|nr:triacylglycerol lipase [Oscillospiraceae bacterium]